MSVGFSRPTFNKTSMKTMSIGLSPTFSKLSVTTVSVGFSLGLDVVVARVKNMSVMNNVSGFFLMGAPEVAIASVLCREHVNADSVSTGPSSDGATESTEYQ